MELTRLNSNYRRVTITRRNNSGDPCPVPKCDGHLVLQNTYLLDESGRRIRKMTNDAVPVTRVRLFHCGLCGFLPEENKLTLPVEHAPPQRRKRS